MSSAAAPQGGGVNEYASGDPGKKKPFVRRNSAKSKRGGRGRGGGRQHQGHSADTKDRAISEENAETKGHGSNRGRMYRRNSSSRGGYAKSALGNSYRTSNHQPRKNVHRRPSDVVSKENSPVLDDSEPQTQVAVAANPPQNHTVSALGNPLPPKKSELGNDLPPAKSALGNPLPPQKSALGNNLPRDKKKTGTTLTPKKSAPGNNLSTKHAMHSRKDSIDRESRTKKSSLGNEHPGPSAGTASLPAKNEEIQNVSRLDNSPRLSPVLKEKTSTTTQTKAVLTAPNEKTSTTTQTKAAEPQENKVSDATTKAITALRSDLLRLEKENEALKLQNTDLESKFLAEQEISKKKDADLRTMEKVLGTFEDLRANLEQQRESYRVKYVKSETDRKAIVAEMERLKKRGGNVGSLASNASVVLESRISQLETKVGTVQAELDAKSEEVESLKRDMSMQAIDLEVKDAQEEYMKVRLDNLEAELVSKDATIVELTSSLVALERQAEHKEEVTKLDDDKPMGGKVVEGTDSPDEDNAPNGLSEEEEYDDGDAVWLFAITPEEREDFRQEMEYSPEQVHIFSQLSDLRDQLVLLLDKYGDAKLIQNILKPLVNSESDSKEFWKAAQAALSEICNHDVLFCVICPSSKDAKLNLLLRKFVSVVAEAYEGSTEPGKVVLVLEGWTQDQIGGEDATGEHTAPRFHDVIPYGKWIQQT